MGNSIQVQRQSRSIADSSYLDAAIACSNYVAAVGRNSLQQPLSAIAGSNFAAFLNMLSRRQGRCRSYDFPATIAAAIAGTNFAAVDMSSLWHSRGIAASSYLAAAVACSNYVAAVDMTSLQQPRSAIAGSNFTAVAMSSLRQSLSIADNNYFAVAVARCNYVAAVETHSLQQSLSTMAGSDFAAVAIRHLRQSLFIADSHSNRCPSRTATTLLQS